MSVVVSLIYFCPSTYKSYVYTDRPHPPALSRVRSFTSAQPPICPTHSGQTALSVHHFGGYQKYALWKGYSHSFWITCDTSAVSLLESRGERYIKAINNSDTQIFPHLSALCSSTCLSYVHTNTTPSLSIVCSSTCLSYVHTNTIQSLSTLSIVCSSTRLSYVHIKKTHHPCLSYVHTNTTPSLRTLSIVCSSTCLSYVHTNTTPSLSTLSTVC